MIFDILIVDDEQDTRILLSDILEEQGYKVRTANDGHGAVESLLVQRPGLILLDIWLGDTRFDGIKVLEKCLQEYPDVPVLLMVGHGTLQTALAGIKMGAYDFIEKPFKADRLLMMMGRIQEVMQLRAQNQLLRSGYLPLEPIPPASRYLAALQETIKKTAGVQTRVCITGAPGVGKREIARAIHQASAREKGPLVELCCATTEDFEKVLFGRECGVSDIRSPGVIELTHTGTLVLRHVAHMPLACQSRMARFLQDGLLHRGGSERPFRVDVRVIATSSVDLEHALATGRLREDLYDRLNVLPIGIRPLRQRCEDILPLAHYFLKHATVRYGRCLYTLHDAALTALQSYSWPANVRELRHVIEWTVMMLPSGFQGQIMLDHLPAYIAASLPRYGDGETASEVLELPLREARALFERRYLISQIARFSGKVSHVARFVGMERAALHRKLRALGVTAER